jgi:hypothetical protein
VVRVGKGYPRSYIFSECRSKRLGKVAMIRSGPDEGRHNCVSVRVPFLSVGRTADLRRGFRQWWAGEEEGFFKKQRVSSMSVNKSVDFLFRSNCYGFILPSKDVEEFG